MRFNIQEMIAKKKAKFQEKRNIKNLSRIEKADRLRAERIEREKEQAIKDYEREEKAKIRELKYGKYKKLAGKIGSGMKQVHKNIQANQKARLKSDLSKGPFSTGSRNVFYDQPKEEKPKPKKIVINL